MGKSIEEYAALYPLSPSSAAEFEALEAINRAAAAAAEEGIKSRQRDIGQAMELKKIILRQLERGAEPQSVLFLAVKAIGLLVNDPGFIETAAQHIEDVYSDLAQQSLLVDNDSIALERLQEKAEAYNTKLRRQLERQLAASSRINKELSNALNELIKMGEPLL